MKITNSLIRRVTRLFDMNVARTLQRAPTNAPQRRITVDSQFAIVRLNREALDGVLSRAPMQDVPGPRPNVILALPLPDGRFSRFVIEESPMLAPELAAAFPEESNPIRGIGLDDPTATARLDWTSGGLHGQVLAADATVYIDPFMAGDLTIYMSYTRGISKRRVPTTATSWMARRMRRFVP